MTEIKTAKAWGGFFKDGFIKSIAMPKQSRQMKQPVVIVHIPGLTHDQTEQDIRDGLSLLAKSLEVCEWTIVRRDTFGPDRWLRSCDGKITDDQNDVRPCWCGRKVVVK